jgi:opacity protein-like surface antigen
MRLNRIFGQPPSITAYFGLGVALLAAFSPNAIAQEGGWRSDARYEFGGAIGGSFYDSKTLSGPGGSADAGFENGVAGSIWLGHQMYPKISGEIRYDIAANDLKLNGGNTNVNFSGRTHAIHYDLHFHLNKASAKLRPYIIAGGGIKIYEGTGTETIYQPLSTIALLTKTSELKGMLTFGVGVKVAVTHRVSVRLEFRDNLSPFPSKVIMPNQSKGADGWLNDFMPMAGISLVF